MFRRPGAQAMRFTATERFAVERVAFSWKARFPIAPLVSVKVLDGYAHGSGMLRVRALGFPVQTRSGRDIDAGEAYRYLAELPWVPHAMAGEPRARMARVRRAQRRGRRRGGWRTPDRKARVRRYRASCAAPPTRVRATSMEAPGRRVGVETSATTELSARSECRPAPRCTGTSPRGDSSTGADSSPPRRRWTSRSIGSDRDCGKTTRGPRISAPRSRLTDDGRGPCEDRRWRGTPRRNQEAPRDQGANDAD